MRKSFWYIIAVTIILGLVISLWYTSDEDEEIRASVSVAEAMGDGDQEGYLRVTEPREFIFPDDHGPHPGYKTEWWYYTGNLFTKEGRQFGYQFTIFRSQLNPPTEDKDDTADGSDWSTNQLYLGHFAISDVKNKDHIFEERYSRGAAGLAGAEVAPYRIWLEDWEIVRKEAPESDNKNFPVQVRAFMDNGTAIDLNITPAKPLVLQGNQGYDIKGSGEGNASYYLSFTRMDTEGIITKGGEEFEVSGSSWMDHEWSTSALDETQEGWDWFSIQLSNGYDLMYYQLRNKDGSVGKFTTGSLVDSEGNKTSLNSEDVELEVLDTWQSPHTNSIYPSKWIMRIPKVNLTLNLGTLFADQEMAVSVQYYEGTISVSGKMNGENIGGYGFIEMTGYEHDKN